MLCRALDLSLFRGEHVRQLQMMVRHTSILLSLAISRKKRLEEAAEARGETLESFILEAAEAEAERLGVWLSEKGHSVDHPIYSSIDGASQALEIDEEPEERQVATRRVAVELGWGEGTAEDWLGDVDRLIEGLDTLDSGVSSKVAEEVSTRESRRSARRSVASVQVLNPVQGVVVDMSATGLGIETRGPFSVPEEVFLSIGQAFSSAKLRAEVRWCELVRTERFEGGDVIPVYRSGLAFLGN